MPQPALQCGCPAPAHLPVALHSCDEPGLVLTTTGGGQWFPGQTTLIPGAWREGEERPAALPACSSPSTPGTRSSRWVHRGAWAEGWAGGANDFPHTHAHPPSTSALPFETRAVQGHCSMREGEKARPSRRTNSVPVWSQQWWPPTAAGRLWGLFLDLQVLPEDWAG